MGDVYIMKKDLKKLAIPIALMVFLSTPAFAVSEQNYDDYTEAILSRQNEGKRYINFVGTIAEITKENGALYIKVEENDQTRTFRIHEDTLLLDNEDKAAVEIDKLQKNQKVNVFFKSDHLINVPDEFLTEADVLVVKSNKNTFVKLDVFDKNLLSESGDLQLNVSDKTKIVDWEGHAISKNQIQNKKLLVFYSVTTRSVPPQTSPEKIILLDSANTENDTIHENDDLSKNEILSQIKDSDIYRKNGVTYIALSNIASKAGFDTSWKEEARLVSLENGYKFFELTIDERVFKYNGKEYILDHSPIIVNDRTFIEESFLDKLIS